MARSRPSWGWQSILYGRQLLERGLCWQIGNGQTVFALNSKWIPCIHPGIPAYSPQVLSQEDGIKVAELLVPGEGRWADEKLDQWFDPATCRDIRSIPLPRRDVEDKLVWHGTCDGIFSVKSAYHLAVLVDKQKGTLTPTVSLMGRRSRLRLWNSSIHPKLKVFL
ncbi:unnamed protein product [Linum trigynum]|uniref:Uncharacterized protein n=1 Tax=Linum trigynum TaxID=586398 RepID=A0AAV2CW29_9ROSI